ncbi:hypothetical protein [Nonomuraea wenchangensis]|uniref:Uncharacterized protein n=1 Tax=Nonomuraea wenchangensis TaxID=568860 RepID=A0A1I0LWS8_9ACTN|nr:hypothetical protein [Nonomuraea wenchangensis]SEU46875.1 hypothetical protein SAMN05421811_127168 [Nonomuraea wenchangensis]
MAKVQRGKPSERPRILAEPEPVITGEQVASAVAVAEPMTDQSVEQVLTGQLVPPVAALADIPDAPDFTPAADGADPEAAFAHYDSTISRARAKVEKVLTKAERYWRLTAGPALKEIRDNQLYKAAGFATFERYVDERWDMSRPRAYQLIDSVRAMQALEGVTDEVPNERQLRALLPVVDQHGTEAAGQVWKLAEERGRTSGAGLDAAARDLGFLPALEAAKQDGPKPEVVWPRYEPVFRALGDLRGLRRVAVETPDRARELAARLRQAAEELEADLPAPDNG